MAIVKNQSIPTDQFEENLNPPIPFDDQYRRALSEGIDHPKLPAGEEIVTFSKLESRPAQRSDNPYYDKPDQQAWRDGFTDCETCWKTQFRTEADLDECHSAGSKHYVEPWHYVPGAKSTYFGQFMSACLNWFRDNPGVPYPKCEDLTPDPAAFQFCPTVTYSFYVANGNNPQLTGASCGTIISPTEWQAPATPGECPSEVILSFTDDDGRKGCAYGVERSESECCCEDPPALAISYATLLMACSAQQTLSASGESPGCPPYTWALSGGGSLSTNEGASTVYTAPATNDGCTNNPTITLTDSCGQTAEIKIAVNCNSADADAFATWTDAVTFSIANCGFACGYGNGPLYSHGISASIFHCDGTLHRTKANAVWIARSPLSSAILASNQTVCAQGGQGVNAIKTLATTGWHLATNPSSNGANCGCLDPGNQGCGTFNTNAVGNSAPVAPLVTGIPGQDDAWDVRTAAQKTAGCCPINPITGLPF